MQPELAEVLYVSRIAVSKWESCREYPNVDSLKAIAKFFGITIDELLSGDELQTLAEEDTKQEEIISVIWFSDCSTFVWRCSFFSHFSDRP